MKQLMNKLLSSIVVLVAVLGTPLAAAVPVQAAGVDVFKAACKNSQNSELCTNNGDNLFEGRDSIWRRIINTMIYVIGAVAVIMIVIGGLRYTLSGGDQQAVNGAKNTIIYSVVGLVVALMSFAIVNFVIGRL